MDVSQLLSPTPESERLANSFIQKELALDFLEHDATSAADINDAMGDGGWCTGGVGSRSSSGLVIDHRRLESVTEELDDGAIVKVVYLGGTPCGHRSIWYRLRCFAHDTTVTWDVMDIQRMLDDRSQRDEFLREHYASPLPEEHRESFPGLDYFPPDASWVVSGEYETIDPHDVQIPSTAGMDNPYTKVGVVRIAMGDVVYRLTVIDDGDGGAFVPFRDGTCGTETYAGGRYVGISAASSGAVAVDFNDARNPWCVYDEEFVCPLPPAENWIAERIPAGEMMYRPTV